MCCRRWLIQSRRRPSAGAVIRTLAITLREVEALGGLAMSTDDSKKVAALLQAVPNGVQAMSSDIEAWSKPP